MTREIMKKIPPDGWRAMITAPRDGTLIIVLYGDGGGVELVKWAEIEVDGKPDHGWFRPDTCDDPIDISYDKDWAGWILFPEASLIDDRHYWDGQE